MPEQSLNSLFGMSSTKELPAAGILKTTSNSLQSNQSSKGENSFIAKLANSMKNASTIDDQNSTPVPYELNKIPSIEGINHLIDMASIGAPTNIATNIHGDQMPLYQILNHDIPVEAFTNGIINYINSDKASPVHTQANTFPGHSLPGNQGSSAFNEPNIDLARIMQETTRGSHPGLPSTSFTDKLNTSQISTETNEQNVTGILNKLNPAKIADTTGSEPLSQSSKIPGKQIVKSLKKSDTNLLNVQLDTNKNSSQEQTPAPSVNNFNTKINEQNAAGILNKLDPAKIADTTGKEPLSQSSRIPGKQIAESLKKSDTNLRNVQLDTNKNSNQEQTPAPSLNNFNTKINEQNAAGILKLDTAKIADTTGSEPLSQSSRIPGKQIAESHKGYNANALNVQLDTNKNFIQPQTPAPSVNNFNTNQSNQNNAKTNNQNTVNNADKLDNAPTIEKISSELTVQASRTSNSSTNSLSQYNSKLAQTDINESQKILGTHPDATGATVSKSSDNTNSTNNFGVNSINTDETVLQVTTSPENSSFSNQETDTPDEFYINTLNSKQKVEPGKNFTSTLSQINNLTKPFESLGSDTADNIIQKAKLFMEGGKSEVKIQLNPPELGFLKLEFEVEDDNLEIKIKVERSAVKDVIEKDIPRLRELVSNTDINVGKLDVSLQGNGDGQLSLMDKDLQSGSESDHTKDLPDQDKEFIEDGIDEESIEYDEDSNKINFLV